MCVEQLKNCHIKLIFLWATLRESKFILRQLTVHPWEKSLGLAMNPKLSIKQMCLSILLHRNNQWTSLETRKEKFSVILAWTKTGLKDASMLAVASLDKNFHLGTFPVLPSGNSADVTLIESSLTFLLFFVPLSTLIWTPFYHPQVLLEEEMRVMIKDMLRDKIIPQLFVFADGFDYHSYIGKDFRGRNKTFSIPSGVKITFSFQIDISI